MSGFRNYCDCVRARFLSLYHVPLDWFDVDDGHMEGRFEAGFTVDEAVDDVLRDLGDVSLVTH